MIFDNLRFNLTLSIIEYWTSENGALRYAAEINDKDGVQSGALCNLTFLYPTAKILFNPEYFLHLFESFSLIVTASYV